MVSSVDGDTITLTGIAGAELEYETIYVITGTVADAAGNETTIDIWFVTESLE
ncbi:MAG: hypothetical protein OXI43_13440 [Candidatus Poribacteria bacterium]|nr:hypothetical protein [Candidatus Poribacteria bacterium]